MLLNTPITFKNFSEVSREMSKLNNITSLGTFQEKLVTNICPRNEYELFFS